MTNHTNVVTINKELREIIYTIMIPDLQMLRPANQFVSTSHYISFSYKDIQKAFSIFTRHKKSYIESVEEQTNGKVYLSALAGKHIFGLDVPNGTWVMSVRCDTDEDLIKLIDTGISLEGFYTYKDDNVDRFELTKLDFIK